VEGRKAGEVISQPKSGNFSREVGSGLKPL